MPPQTSEERASIARLWAKAAGREDLAGELIFALESAYLRGRLDMHAETLGMWTPEEDTCAK